MKYTYKDSGVDVEGAQNFVKKISPIVKSTFSKQVITDIGGFNALFAAEFSGYEEPVLVSGTDGVGTKLKIAQLMDKHDTVGIDAVAMCANDILVSGADPLFFLDYISCGKLNEDVLVDVVKGVSEGCRIAGCSLVGGETAEHPNVMKDGDYDIAGFVVGVVDKKKIISGKDVQIGDVIVGLPSSGVHSNGFSLIRKLLLDPKKYSLGDEIPGLSAGLGSALLAPTRIYCKPVLECLKKDIPIKAMVHITGGGFYENIPRILPEKTAAMIDKASFEITPVFQFIQKEGNIEEREMFSTFNMGIGFMIIIGKEAIDGLLDILKLNNEKPVIIGKIGECRDEKVILA